MGKFGHGRHISGCSGSRGGWINNRLGLFTEHEGSRSFFFMDDGPDLSTSRQGAFRDHYLIPVQDGPPGEFESRQRDVVIDDGLEFLAQRRGPLILSIEQKLQGGRLASLILAGFVLLEPELTIVPKSRLSVPSCEFQSVGNFG